MYLLCHSKPNHILLFGWTAYLGKWIFKGYPHDQNFVGRWRNPNRHYSLQRRICSVQTDNTGDSVWTVQDDILLYRSSFQSNWHHLCSYRFKALEMEKEVSQISKPANIGRVVYIWVTRLLELEVVEQKGLCGFPVSYGKMSHFIIRLLLPFLVPDR